MTQTPNDPTAAGDAPGQDAPSEEEMRAYLEQLRSAPVDQLLVEVLSSLLNAAQVKLGRRDGRLLLDVSAVLIDEVRPALPDELQTQLDSVVSQLRLAQVEAEPQVAAAIRQGQTEPNDLSDPDTDQTAGQGDDNTGQDAGNDDRPAAAAPTAPSPAPDSRGSGTASRLWVPGA